MLNTIVIVLDVLSALFLIVTILLHSGRGSGLSDMFGGGEQPLRRDGHGAHPRPHHGRHGVSCSASARSGSPGAGTPDRGALGRC